MRTGPIRLLPACPDIVGEEAGMAVARDQAARAIRPDAETAEGDAARDTSGQAPGGHALSPGDQLRHSVAEETRRTPADAPNAPPEPRPGGPSASAPVA